MLKNIFRKRNFSTTGIVDLGTIEQKKKLYKVEELVSTPAAVSLATTSPERWKIYPRRNQDRTDSCVFQSRAKAAGILQEMTTGEFVEYSAADYNKRSNRTQPEPYNRGAYPVESFDLWRKEGVGLETLEPSQNINAQQLDSVKQNAFGEKVAKVSLLDGYYALPAYDFNMIISTLHATKKPIPLGFFGNYSEWNRDVPTIQTNISLQAAEVRHAVCATPNYGIYQGQEGFTIEDSWGSTGIGGLGVRWITKDFFVSRAYIPGLVPTSFKTFEEMEIDPKKPKYTFTRDLQYGMTGEDVRMLQEVMKYEGFFPANHVGSNFFGSITQKCVEEFQKKYNIVDSGTPSTTGFGRVGSKTRTVLNKIYS